MVSRCVNCLTYNLIGVVGVFRPSVLYVNNNVSGRNRGLLTPLHAVIRGRECAGRGSGRAIVYGTDLNGSTNVVNTTFLRWLAGYWGLLHSFKQGGVFSTQGTSSWGGGGFF